MKKLQSILLTLILIGFTSCINNNIHDPASYYLNNETGNDDNPGTLKKPLKTISSLNTQIKAKPGNIFFAGGQVFEGTLVVSGINGNDSVAVAISSYGNGRAEINGGNNEAIRIKNCKNIRIAGLNIRGNGRKDGNTTNGLQLAYCNDVRIDSMNCEGFQKSGIDLYNCNDAEITNVAAIGNGFCGINIMGSSQDSSSGILIKDCKAENNAGDPTRLDNHSGNGILVGVSRNVTIDHCTATNNGWDMPRQGNGPVGIWTWMSDRVTIQYCISYRNRTSKGGKDGGGFDLDGGVTNSVIQYCLSYENEGAGYGLFQYPGASGWQGNIIRYCVSINDAHTTEGAGSFFIWNGSGDSSQLSDCYIYNNVVYNELAPVISFENASEHRNFLFTNNIFIGKEQFEGKNTIGSRFLGNVWWGPGGITKFGKYISLKSWAAATGQEMENGSLAGIQTDPRLRGPFTTAITDPYQLDQLTGYTLNPDSPLLNNGRSIQAIYGTTPPEQDFFNNPIPDDERLVPGLNQLIPKSQFRNPK